MPNCHVDQQGTKKTQRAKMLLLLTGLQCWLGSTWRLEMDALRPLEEGRKTASDAGSPEQSRSFWTRIHLAQLGHEREAFFDQVLLILETASCQTLLPCLAKPKDCLPHRTRRRSPCKSLVR